MPAASGAPMLASMGRVEAARRRVRLPAHALALEQRGVACAQPVVLSEQLLLLLLALARDARHGRERRLRLLLLTRQAYERLAQRLLALQ